MITEQTRMEELRLRARDIQNCIARGYTRFAFNVRAKELELRLICPSEKEWSYVWDYMVKKHLITKDGPVYYRLGIRL